jgi:hypothetical protein
MLSLPSQKQAAKTQQQAPARKPPTPEETDTLKLKKAWEVALAPVKGLPMTAIMMYMSGNSLQIFSIMMVFMAFKNPIMGILSTNQAFERFESERNRGAILQVKLAYVAMQIVALALGVWKVNAMGLLPYVPVYLLTSLTKMTTLVYFVCRYMADTSTQDDEIRLASMGRITGSTRACRGSSLMYFSMSRRIECRIESIKNLSKANQTTPAVLDGPPKN